MKTTQSYHVEPYLVQLLKEPFGIKKTCKYKDHSWLMISNVVVEHFVQQFLKFSFTAWKCKNPRKKIKQYLPMFHQSS